MLTNFLITAILLSSVVYFVIRFFDNKYYKDELNKEKYISSFSKTRMELMRMVYMKEVDIHSSFFKYIYCTTGYSISALYFYKNKNDAINNINIMKETVSHAIDFSKNEEFKDLNYEQKRMWANVTKKVLNLYWETHYFEKLIFKLILKIIKRNVQTTIEKLYLPTQYKDNLVLGIEANQCLNTCCA